MDNKTNKEDNNDNLTNSDSLERVDEESTTNNETNPNLNGVILDEEKNTKDDSVVSVE